MIPQAFPYTLVLTHDVDHARLSDYAFFSRVGFSFVKHCFWSNLVRLRGKDISALEYLGSIGWGLLYPLVKLRLVKDPWGASFERLLQLEMEYNVRSTFFFITVPERAGYVKRGVPAPSNRVGKYAIAEYAGQIKRLIENGWEVGVHGIDAHLSTEDAIEEAAVLRRYVPRGYRFGLRMHWLYRSEGMCTNLKAAGYSYDASYGDRHNIGFPGGHYGPFQVDGVWVLPLNVMDATLLRPFHLGLSLRAAWERVEGLLDEAKRRGAVVTVLWHTNVFGAYNYWGEIYEKLLIRAQRDGAKIGRCRDVLEPEVSGHERFSWAEPPFSHPKASASPG